MLSDQSQDQENIFNRYYALELTPELDGIPDCYTYRYVLFNDLFGVDQLKLSYPDSCIFPMID